MVYNNNVQKQNPQKVPRTKENIFFTERNINIKYKRGVFAMNVFTKIYTYIKQFKIRIEIFLVDVNNELSKMQW